MLQVLHPLDAGLLGPGQVIHDHGARQELGPPHVALHPQLLLALPVARDPVVVLEDVSGEPGLVLTEKLYPGLNILANAEKKPVLVTTESRVK